MAKIASLTKEQEARFPEFVDKWQKIGLSTDPINFEEAKKSAVKLYEETGLKAPDTILYARSPKEAISIIKNIDSSMSESSIFFDMSFGNQEASWLSFYDYMQEVVGVTGFTNGFNLLVEFAKNCCWWSAYETLAVLQDRPSELHRDPENRLHNTSGPAVKYRDGYFLYFFHGISVPEDIILDRSSITVDRIEKETNAEVRRIMIDLFGVAEYLKGTNAEKIHSDSFGTLWRKKIDGDEDIMMVEVLNSTPEPKPKWDIKKYMTRAEYQKDLDYWKEHMYKTYFLRVHPQLRPMKLDGTFGAAQKFTAKNAVASTFGKTGAKYNPSIET
jgi:hypothetical protein